MRETLFKAKRLSDGAWVEGFPYWGEYSGAFILQNKTYSRRNARTGEISMGDNVVPIEVDPSTVCQYTGLTDKNGKKIFEGDVLKIAKKSDGLGAYFFPPLEYPANVMVKWDMCAWMWETLGENKYYISFPEAWCHYECEIIGNIYDGEGGRHEGAEHD